MYSQVISALVICCVHVALSRLKGKGAISLLISTQCIEKSYPQHKNTVMKHNSALLTAVVKEARIDSVWRLNSYLYLGANVKK